MVSVTDQLKEELQRVRRGDSAALFAVLDKYFPPPIVAQANNNDEPTAKKPKREQQEQEFMDDWEQRMDYISDLPPEIAVMIFDLLAFDERWLVGIRMMGPKLRREPVSKTFLAFYDSVLGSLRMTSGENANVPLRQGDPPAVKHVRAGFHISITSAEEFVDTAVVILSTLYAFISELRDPRAEPYAKEEEDWVSLGGMVDTRLNYARNFPFRYLAPLSWQVYHVMQALQTPAHAATLPLLLQRLTDVYQVPPQQLFDKLLLFLGGYPRFIRQVLWEHEDDDAAWPLVLQVLDEFFFARYVRLDPALPSLLVPSDLLLETILASHKTNDAITYTEMYARARLAMSFEPYRLSAQWPQGRYLRQPKEIPDGYQWITVIQLQVLSIFQTADHEAMSLHRPLATGGLHLQAVDFDAASADDVDILDFFESVLGPHDLALVKAANARMMAILLTEPPFPEIEIEAGLWRITPVVMGETPLPADVRAPTFGWHSIAAEQWHATEFIQASFPITALADVGRMLHMEKPRTEDNVAFVQRLWQFSTPVTTLLFLRVLVHQASRDTEAFKRLPWLIDPMERLHVLLLFSVLILNDAFDDHLKNNVLYSALFPVLPVDFETDPAAFNYFLESALRQRGARWEEHGVYYGDPLLRRGPGIARAALAQTDGMLFLLEAATQEEGNGTPLLSTIAAHPGNWSSFSLPGEAIESQWAGLASPNDQLEPYYIEKGDRRPSSLYLPTISAQLRRIVVDHIARDIMLFGPDQFIDFSKFETEPEAAFKAGISPALHYDLIPVHAWWLMWLQYHEMALGPTTLLAFILFFAAIPPREVPGVMEWKLHEKGVQALVDFIQDRNRDDKFTGRKLFRPIPAIAVDDNFPQRLLDVRQTLWNIIHQEELAEEALPKIWHLQRLIGAVHRQRTGIVYVHRLWGTGLREKEPTPEENETFWSVLEEETGWPKERWPKEIHLFGDHIELRMAN